MVKFWTFVSSFKKCDVVIFHTNNCDDSKAPTVLVTVLQTKMDRYDEMSNTTRIKNKLLLDSYINSFNNTVNNV